jgi:hypothetical protein
MFPIRHFAAATIQPLCIDGQPRRERDKRAVQETRSGEKNLKRIWRLASFAELREVVGERAAVRLSVVFGGTRLYIPVRADPGGWLAQAIGIDAANALCRAFNREQIDIPLGPGKLTRQREKIVAMRSRGMSERAIALDLDMTERQVRYILSSSGSITQSARATQSQVIR